MKKIAKLLAVLLPLAIVFTGCQNGTTNGDNGDDLDWSTSGNWVTVWSPIADADGSVHFHVGGGGPGFLEIQRIYLNNSQSETGATTIFNFTASPAHLGGDSAHFWWVGPAIDTNAADVGTANGRLVLASDGDNYVFGGGFGSPLLNDNAYIGFVIRTDDGGNVRFGFGPDTHANHSIVLFSNL
ncbi:MAG: hypothetical protein FWD88_04940, partial [Treponema sp.]|nr:hypothetical protein [Treponema sp.]